MPKYGVTDFCPHCGYDHTEGPMCHAATKILLESKQVLLRMHVATLEHLKTYSSLPDSILSAIDFLIQEVKTKHAEYKHCGQCNSKRKGDKCWKCGAETFVPDAEWTYPLDPPLDKIVALAREVGYSIGVHGSQERDLDLIAAPWTDDAIGNYAFMEHMATGLGTKLKDYERKPLGRYACIIQMPGYFKCIDLSVAPRLSVTELPLKSED